MSTIWQWAPNWRTPITERYEWMTGLLSSKNRTEQAVRVRNLPRVTIEFEAMVHAQDRRRFEATLFSAQAGEWLLPIWRDVSHLPSGLPSGSTTVAAETDYRTWQAGGQVVIVSSAGVEAVGVTSASGGTVILSSGTTIDHTPGARIYPAYPARIIGGEQAVTHITDEVATLRCRFRLLQGIDHSAASSTTYRSLPVLAQSPDWIGDLGASYRRQLAVLDYGASIPYVEDTAGVAEIVQTHRWRLNGRQAIDDYLGWVYAARGRQGAFWLPSWQSDLVLSADIGATDTQIDVEHIGYTTHLLNQRNRRDIEILLHDGTVYRRRITNATELSPTTERLVIDAALGAAVAASDVRRISWLQVARQEADAIEIVWDADSIAAAAQELRVVNDDL